MRPVGFSLRQLEYFIAVANTGTMSAAAGQFHVSQSAVSLAVGQMERTLGVQLFLRRRSKGLSLTPAGSQLLTDARRLLEHAGELQASARSLGQELTGRLVVGCFPTLTPFLMGRMLEEFPRRHPGVVVDFLEGSVAQLQDWLLDGRCEAALMYDIGIGPGIRTTVLHRSRPYVLLPAAHRLARRKAVWLRELAAEPLVMIDMPPSEQHLTEMLTNAGVTPHIRHRTTSFESVRSLVARGAGYGLLIQRPALASSYEALPLATLEIRDDIAEVPVLLATPAAGRLTRRAQAFVEFCTDAFASARP
ncbi:MAG: LysR family transcriptional regulator [Nocardioidaceae bacterium]